MAQVANFLQIGKELYVNEAIELGPQSHIKKLTTNSDLQITTVGTGLVQCNDVGFTGNRITTVNTNADLQLSANGTGNIMIDSPGYVVIDSEAGDIYLKDGGTGYGILSNSAGNLEIKSGNTTALSMTGANVRAQGNLSVAGSQVDFTALPTSDPGVAGRLWRDGTTVKISV